MTLVICDRCANPPALAGGSSEVNWDYQIVKSDLENQREQQKNTTSKFSPQNGKIFTEFFNTIGHQQTVICILQL